MKQVIQKWISAALVVLVCLTLIQPVTTQAQENVMALNSKVTGQITDTNKVFTYKVTLPKRGTLSIDLKSWIDSIVDYRILDNQGTEIEDASLYGDALTPGREIVTKRFEAGVYYVEISQWSEGHTGKFELTNSFAEVSTDDREPNNGTSVAQPLTLGKKVRGFISVQDEKDVYRVVLPKAGTLSIDWISNISGTAELYLRNELNQVIRHEQMNSKVESSNRYKEPIDLEPGTYYIEIEDWDAPNNTGKYELLTTFVPANNRELEPNNGTSQAMPLAFYKPLIGFLSWSDTEDFYKVRLPKASTLTIDMNSFVQGIAEVEVYDVNYKQLMKEHVYGSVSSPGKAVESLKLKSGTYYVAVKAWDAKSDTGKYSLEVRSSHLLPSLTVNSVTTRSTVIKGKTAKYANVYFKIGKKTYTRKANSKGDYSFKMKKQKAGSVIRVTAKNKYGSTVKQVTVKK